MTTVDPSVYSELNEGLGGCYERVAYSNRLLDLSRRYSVRKVLELGATYIAGIPGFNSCILAQEGLDVTVAVNSRDYQDTLEAWSMLGLTARVLRHDDILNTPFPDESFDMVWNHLALEHYKDGRPLLREMSRLSRRVVVTLTLTPWNLGFLIHRASHALQKKPWDHGLFWQSTHWSMVRQHKAEGLTPIEVDGCDVPPWMDTVDGKIRGSMTYFDSYPEALRNRWIWCSADPRCREHKLVKLFWKWETAMPRWFRMFACHHLYVASLKPAVDPSVYIG